MILSVQQLKNKYKDYRDYYGKIARDIKDNKVYPIAKKLYETNKNVEGKYLASYILGPSYLSFDYMLSYYGLIPERVYVYTCASFNKNKIKEYEIFSGRYLYRDIPQNAFPVGVITKIEDNYSYQIATPEKALCDKLYIIRPRSTIKDLEELLFNDLRIEEKEFFNLNPTKILEYASLYNAKNLKLLISYVKKRRELWTD